MIAYTVEVANTGWRRSVPGPGEVTDRTEGTDWRLVAKQLYEALAGGPASPMRFNIHQLAKWNNDSRVPALKTYVRAKEEWAAVSNSASREGE